MKNHRFEHDILEICLNTEETSVSARITFFAITVSPEFAVTELRNLRE